jgi:hypothetical protein
MLNIIEIAHWAANSSRFDALPHKGVDAKQEEVWRK